MSQPHACPAHRPLVLAALGPDPSDEILERYADEVPSCEACRRALAVQLGVHPARLQTAPPARFRLAGMAELSRALWPQRALRPWPALAAGAALALAAALLLAWRLSQPEDPALHTALSPGPVQTPEVEDVVAGTGPGDLPPAPVAPRMAAPEMPAAPLPPEPVVVRAPVRPAPTRQDPQHTGSGTAPVPEAELDAVASADWPAPPFEDLRRGAPKSAAPALRAVQLVLVGQPGYRVGEGVDLVVVASYDTPITVCVEGPERGTVWRGAVPAGRTALTRGGQQQAFAFSAPGTYRFLVSPTGQPQCGDTLSVVEVEVLP